MSRIPPVWTLILLLPVACSHTPSPSNGTGAGEPPPRNANDYVESGDACFERGDYGKAIEDYQSALRLEPENANACSSYAWLLATCPRDDLRNGKKAVELATKACELEHWEDGDCLSSLAAAHAECGNFKEAVRWQKKAIQMGFNDKEEMEDARHQLKLYEAGKPYRHED